MNPWTIIGWAVITVVCLVMLIPLAGLYLALAGKYARWKLHVKTRDIKPVEGQKWMQDGEVLRIGERHAKGHFTIYTGTKWGMSQGSWGERDEAWAERVKNRKLYLIEE